jgi:glycosyltransferase involved in cell wall biosynthesis
MKKINGVSVFLPVYNEEKILVRHVMIVYNAVKRLGRPFEIVIVDDSSRDNTPIIADNLSRKYSNIRHRRFEDGPSRRENLGVAMKEARYPIIIFMDMDLSVNLEFIPNLILEIEKGYDIAIGSRYMGLKPHREFYRLMISRMYNKLWRILFHSGIKDHNCGFKAAKKGVLKRVMDELGYDSKHLRGWFWDAEFLITAQMLNYKIAEFPVTWDSGKQSSFNVRRELRMVPYIIRKSALIRKKMKSAIRKNGCSRRWK